MTFATNMGMHVARFGPSTRWSRWVPVLGGGSEVDCTLKRVAAHSPTLISISDTLPYGFPSPFPYAFHTCCCLQALLLPVHHPCMEQRVPP